MEKGFFHTSRGYWQTTNEPPQHIRDTFPAGTVEVPLKPGADFEWSGSEWVAVPPDPAQQLAAERQTMVCSPLQGQLALGETKWAEVEALLADPETPWAMRVTIGKATEWKRLSQSIDQLAWLVGLDEFQTDDLFRAAMEIDV